MKKFNLIPLILGTILIICGAFIFGFAMGEADWNIKNLSTVKYETNTYEINDDFTSLRINGNTADIHLLPAKDGKCNVVVHEEENNKHNVSVKAGVLCVEPTSKDTIRLGINLDFPKITVYLPEDSYGNLEIKNTTGNVLVDSGLKFDNVNISLSTGDINVANITCTSLSSKGTTGDTNISNVIVSDKMYIERSTGEISLYGVRCDKGLSVATNTGQITLSDIECGDKISINVNTGNVSVTDTTCVALYSEGTTGDINIENVIVSGKMSIERKSGDVKFESSDAFEMFILTDSGDVEGSLISDKVFIVNTDTGRIKVPNTASGGRCEITTDTGDIEISIVN